MVYYWNAPFRIELVPEGGNDYKLKYENDETKKEVSVTMKPMEYVIEYTPENKVPQKLTIKTDNGIAFQFALR